jgi:hypothetical protein
MVMAMRALTAMIVLLPCFARAQTAHETTLYQDDLAKNQRTRIDAPKDAFDAQLDAALGGPQGFSTKALEQIEERIKQELKRDRPRATPRVILFLYPGRIDAERLKALTEVNVDIELIMDPCDRNVCKEAVAKHIELVGRAVGQPVVSTANFRMIFQTLTLKTSTTMHDDEVAMYRVPISACVTAAQRAGGGIAWLDAQEHAESAYEPIVVKAIARHAAERRVQLAAPPSVSRDVNSVNVMLKVRGDRVRTQQQAIDALAAIALGLRDNPRTPSQQALEVDVDTGMRDGPRRFRAPGSPVALYVDRRLSSADLWSNYVGEMRKDAQNMSFGDDEASGRAPVTSGDADAPDPDDNEAIALLSANFSSLGACAKAEAQRNPRFHGVTLTFQWTGQGRASNAGAKEPAYKGSPLSRCLADAVTRLRLPRHNAAPRTIDYPIRVR